MLSIAALIHSQPPVTELASSIENFTSAEVISWPLWNVHALPQRDRVRELVVRELEALREPRLHVLAVGRDGEQRLHHLLEHPDRLVVEDGRLVHRRGVGDPRDDEVAAGLRLALRRCGRLCGLSGLGRWLGGLGRRLPSRVQARPARAPRAAPPPPRRRRRTAQEPRPPRAAPATAHEAIFRSWDRTSLRSIPRRLSAALNLTTFAARKRLRRRLRGSEQRRAGVLHASSPSRSRASRKNSFGACRFSSPLEKEKKHRRRGRASVRPASTRPEACRPSARGAARRRDRPSAAPRDAAAIPGWSARDRVRRYPSDSRIDRRLRLPAGSLRVDVRGDRLEHGRRTLVGHEPARHVSPRPFGITVKSPPPRTPFTSSVGRVQIRSRVVYPGSPCSARSADLRAVGLLVEGNRAPSAARSSSAQRLAPGRRSRRPRRCRQLRASVETMRGESLSSDSGRRRRGGPSGGPRPRRSTTRSSPTQPARSDRRATARSVATSPRPPTRPGRPGADRGARAGSRRGWGCRPPPRPRRGSGR